MTVRARRLPIWLALATVALAACSKGGSGATGTQPDPPADSEPVGSSELDTGIAREVTEDGDLLAVPAPIDVQVQVDNSDVILRWSEPAGLVDGVTYLVGRDGRELAETRETEFRDTGLEDGVHDYQVITVGEDGRWSEPVDASAEVGGPDLFPPSTPWGVEIEIGSGRIVVSWEESVDDQGVTGYLIYRDRDFHAWVTDDLRFVDTDVEAGQTYRYRIQAKDGAGRVSAPVGGLASSDPSDVTPPSAPVIADVTVEGGAVTIDWRDSVDDGEIWGYTVHRDGVFHDWISEASEYVDLVDPGSLHRYVIRAHDAAGNSSLPSELIEVDGAG